MNRQTERQTHRPKQEGREGRNMEKPREPGRQTNRRFGGYQRNPLSQSRGRRSPDRVVCVSRQARTTLQLRLSESMEYFIRKSRMLQKTGSAKVSMGWLGWCLSEKESSVHGFMLFGALVKLVSTTDSRISQNYLTGCW